MDSRLLKGLFDFFDVVGAEIIHDDNVVFPKCGNQIVLQVIHKLLPCSPSAVSRIVRVSAQANGRQDRRAFRRVQRHASDNTFSALRSSVSAGHIRIDSAFIQKDHCHASRITVERIGFHFESCYRSFICKCQSGDLLC